MAEQPLIAAGAQKILSLPAETQFAPNGIVSHTLLRTANARVVLFGFAEGQELTEHTSTQHALVQVLSGECDFSLAGEEHKLKAGDLLYMPPNLPHALNDRVGRIHLALAGLAPPLDVRRARAAEIIDDAGHKIGRLIQAVIIPLPLLPQRVNRALTVSRISDSSAGLVM